MHNRTHTDTHMNNNVLELIIIIKIFIPLNSGRTTEKSVFGVWIGNCGTYLLENVKKDARSVSFFVVNVVVMLSTTPFSNLFRVYDHKRVFVCVPVCVMANHKTIIVHLFSTNIIIIKRKKKRWNKRKCVCNGDDADERNDGWKRTRWYKTRVLFIPFFFSLIISNLFYLYAVFILAETFSSFSSKDSKWAIFFRLWVLCPSLGRSYRLNR